MNLNDYGVDQFKVVDE